MKFQVRKMPTSLLKQHCYCPMLLMRTTKTAVCRYSLSSGEALHKRMTDTVIDECPNKRMPQNSEDWLRLLDFSP